MFVFLSESVAIYSKEMHFKIFHYAVDVFPVNILWRALKSINGSVTGLSPAFDITTGVTIVKSLGVQAILWCHSPNSVVRMSLSCSSTLPEQTTLKLRKPLVIKYIYIIIII